MAKKVQRNKPPIKRPQRHSGQLAWRQAADAEQEQDKEEFSGLKADQERNNQLYFRRLIMASAVSGLAQNFDYTPLNLDNTSVKIAFMSLTALAFVRVNHLYFKEQKHLTEEQSKLSNDFRETKPYLSKGTSNAISLALCLSIIYSQAYDKLDVVEDVYLELKSFIEDNIDHFGPEEAGQVGSSLPKLDQ